MYYDVNKTLTYNSFINMVVGNRGCGKTYGLKKKAIKDFLKKGTQFIYLRRYDTELQLVEDNLFNDIILNEEFPNCNIEYKAGCYFVNDEIAGYAMALTKSSYYKSSSFPLVQLIIYDEFIIDTTQNLRYLKNEVRKFLDFCETIIRMREGVKVFLLANAITLICPYTIYWNMSLKENEKICRANNNLVLLELVEDEEFIKKKKQTTFGQLINDTEFGNYSIENKFLLDNDTFIEQRTKASRYLFTFNYGNFLYACWYDNKTRMVYLDESVDPSYKIIYSFTLDTHEPNYQLLKGSKKGLFENIPLAFKKGLLRFSTLKVKSVGMEILKMFI